MVPNRKSERGNILVEFALIMPVLLLIFAGIIQFGFLLNAKIAVNSASYEAARSATLSDNPEADAIRAAESYASASLPGWSLEDRLKIEFNSAGHQPGDMIQVNLFYEVPLFFSKLITIPGDNNNFFKVKGTSVMQIEEKD